MTAAALWLYARLTPEQLMQWLDDIEPRHIVPFLRVQAHFIRYRPPLSLADNVWRRIADLRTVPQWKVLRDAVVKTGHWTLNEGALSAPWAETEWCYREGVSERNSRARKMRDRKTQENQGCAATDVGRAFNQQEQQREREREDDSPSFPHSTAEEIVDDLGIDGRGLGCESAPLSKHTLAALLELDNFPGHSPRGAKRIGAFARDLVTKTSPATFEAAVKRAVKQISAGQMRGHDPFAYIAAIADNLYHGRSPRSASRGDATGLGETLGAILPGPRAPPAMASRTSVSAGAALRTTRLARTS